MRNGGRFLRVLVTKNTCRGSRKREKRVTRTYIDVPFNVPNQDEVTRPSVVDVGVNGD